MNKLVILSVLASIGFSFGFQRPHQRGAVGFGVKVPSKLFAVQDRGDFPPEESEEYTGSVDWDAEWKKVVAGDGKATGSERPGKEFYKSEAEIAAIKAANKASQTANEIGSNVSNSMPSMGSLSGDWKVSEKKFKHSTNISALFFVANGSRRFALFPLSSGLLYWQLLASDYPF